MDTTLVMRTHGIVLAVIVWTSTEWDSLVLQRRFSSKARAFGFQKITVSDVRNIMAQQLGPIRRLGSG